MKVEEFENCKFAEEITNAIANVTISPCDESKVIKLNETLGFYLSADFGKFFSTKITFIIVIYIGVETRRHHNISVLAGSAKHLLCLLLHSAFKTVLTVT